MSVDTLNASLTRAFAAASYVPEAKAKSSPIPYPETSSWNVDQDFGNSRQFEQLAHFRGRFYSAVRVITARASRQPIYVGRLRSRARRTGNPQSGVIPPMWLGDPAYIDVLRDHPFLSVWRQPNSYMTATNVMEMFVASAYVTGRGFLVWVKGQDRPLDLFSLPATWMIPVHKKNRPYAGWIVKPPGETGDGIRLEAAQVAHFYFADPANPTAAISPLSMVARDVLVDEAISGAQHSGFKNPMPKFALIAGDVMNEQSFTDDPNRTSAARPIRLDPMDRRRIMTWIRQQGASFKNGEPLILDAILRDIKVIDRKPTEMGFLESSNLVREHIFEAVSVSKVLTGSLEGTNRAGAGIAEQFLVDNTLNPLLTGMSQAITMSAGKLFADGNDDLAIWLAEAHPRDSELMIEKLKIGARSYCLLRNEVRRLMDVGLEPIEGMDDVVLPQTMEERDGDEDRVGVGRLGKLPPSNDA